jgi:hypothetical protein
MKLLEYVESFNNFKKSLQSETKKIKTITAQNIKEKWMHGQFPSSSDKKLVDKEQSCQWLKFGKIKGETENTIVAAQDQALGTNCFRWGGGLEL